MALPGMVPGTSLSWHLCVQSLSGEHNETPFCKPWSTFQTGLVSFLLVQRSGFYWIWWSEVNCGSFNTQGAQTFAGVTQCSPGFGVLVCGSARMGSRAYIEGHCVGLTFRRACVAKKMRAAFRLAQCGFAAGHACPSGSI